MRAVRVVLGTALVVFGCSTYDVEGLALVASMNSIIIGDTLTLQVVTVSGAERPASGVSWSSSNDAVATVDSEGLVRGVGPGRVTLEANTDGYTLDVPLLVHQTAGPFVSVASGADHSCALTAAGETWCWGRNSAGQLGTPNPPDICPVPGGGGLFCAAGAIPVSGQPFVDVVAGSFHNCGLTSEGAAYCWGGNEEGQLGDGGLESGPAQLPVGGNHTFRSLAAGQRTTCGVRNDDVLMCWGAGPFQTVGAVVDTATSPTPIAGSLRFRFAETSGQHTCGVSTTGSTWCWGLNDSGQLGVENVDSICGSTPCTLMPQQVQSAPAFTELALGRGFSCGLTGSGDVYCWGANADGQLGDGQRQSRPAAMPVVSEVSFATLRAGSGHVCGLSEAGALHCWGRSTTGFGTGVDSFETDLPVRAAPELTLVEVSVGFDSQCGISPAGLTWCWGGNLDGAVGNGQPQTTTVSSPERVIRHPGFVSRAAPPR